MTQDDQSRVSLLVYKQWFHPILSKDFQASPHILWQGVVLLLFICKLEAFAPPGAPYTSFFVSVSMWHRQTQRLQAVNCH